MIICGIFVGFTISVKFTGFGTAGAIIVHQFIILFINYDREYRDIFKDIFLRFFLIFIPCIFIFYFLFLIHVSILPYVGDGDLFMSDSFRARLLHVDGSIQQEFKHISPLGIWDSVQELISTMHEVNINLRASHPFQSYWYQWIFIQCKAVLYWQKLRAGYGMWIYCVGNAASWLFVAVIGVFGFLFISLLGGFVRFRLAFDENFLSSNPTSFSSCLHNSLEKHWWNAFVLWIGYLGNYIPYIMIPRAVWNYHYVPALLFACMLSGVILQILLETTENYDIIWHNLLKTSLIIVLLSVTACFLYLSPWTYALPMSDILNNDRFLFKSWEFV